MRNVMSERIVKKKKYLIKEVVVNQPERHKSFDIALPRHTHKVTAVIITVSKL